MARRAHRMTETQREDANRQYTSNVFKGEPKAGSTTVSREVKQSATSKRPAAKKPPIVVNIKTPKIAQNAVKTVRRTATKSSSRRQLLGLTLLAVGYYVVTSFTGSSKKVTAPHKHGGKHKGKA